MFSFTPEPFSPARGLSNPHLQTIVANYWRRCRGITFRRRRVDTPDGDFVDLDFAEVKGATWAQLGESAPIVLLLHGLEGSARRSYACEAYRQLAQRGIRAVGLNFRSCSGEMNRSAFLYHAGSTKDVTFVLRLLEEWFPAVPKGMLGFSLGANVLLKFLGEPLEAREGVGEAGSGRIPCRPLAPSPTPSIADPPLAPSPTRPLVKAAVAVSPPFDLAGGSVVMEQGLGPFYSYKFLRTLKEKAQRHAPLVKDKIDLAKVLKAGSLREFDDAWAPLYGFRDAADYYAQSSSGRYLADIRLPTLILRSLDDPFFAKNDVSYDMIETNPYLQAHFTKHGGHMGFIEGRLPSYQFWAERQAARFLAQMLHACSVP